MRHIILLGHQAQVGKDTLANAMVKNLGFIKYAFATSIKNTCKNLFDLTHEQMYGSLKEVPDPRHQNKTPREILQAVGGGMRKISPNVWVDVVKRKIIEEKHQYCVISDFRFRNEYEALLELSNNGYNIHTIKITRPNRPAITNPNDITEIDLQDFAFDLALTNNGAEDMFVTNSLNVISSIIKHSAE